MRRDKEIRTVSDGLLVAADGAETLELGAQEHIDKVHEFLGADKY